MIHIQESYESRPWTPEDDKELLALLTGPVRLSAKQIGWQIDRGGNAVSERAAELGFKKCFGKAGRPRRYSPQVIDEIRKLRGEGLSITEIGLRLSIPANKVHNLCSKYKILCPKNWTPERHAKAKALKEENKTIKEIAKELNCSVASVHRLLRFSSDPLEPRVCSPRKRASHEERVLRSKLASCIRKSKTKKWPCDITYEWLIERLFIQKGLCYYTGIPINYNRYSGSIISIDRLDSDKPYTKDNVVLCTWDANRMKQNLKVDHFVQLCKRISDIHIQTFNPTNPETKMK